MPSFPEDPMRKFKLLSEKMNAMTNLTNLYKINDPLADYRKQIESVTKHFDFTKLAGIDFDDYGHRRILREIEEYEKQRKWNVVGMLDNYKIGDVMPILDVFSNLKKQELESSAKYKELLKSLNPAQEILRSLEATDSLKKYASEMGRLAPQSEFIKNLIDQSNPWLSTLKEQSSSLSRMFDAVSSIQSAIDNELRANLELTEGDFEANSIFDAAVSSFDSPERIDVEEFVVKLVDAFQASSNIKDRKIFATYIFPIILASFVLVLTPIFDFYIKKMLEEVNKTSSKTVVASAKVLVPDVRVLEGYRYVSASLLQVRGKAKIQSRVIGTLTFGQPIRVVERNKSWALVEWRDSENNVQLQGWVLARYLRKFN
jgi:hypothetical protein